MTRTLRRGQRRGQRRVAHRGWGGGAAAAAGADFFWVPHALVAHWIGGPPERQAAALRRYWDGALRPFLSRPGDPGGGSGPVRPARGPLSAPATRRRMPASEPNGWWGGAVAFLPRAVKMGGSVAKHGLSSWSCGPNLKIHFCLFCCFATFCLFGGSPVGWTEASSLFQCPLSGRWASSAFQSGHPNLTPPFRSDFWRGFSHRLLQAPRQVGYAKTFAAALAQSGRRGTDRVHQGYPYPAGGVISSQWTKLRVGEGLKG